MNRSQKFFKRFFDLLLALCFILLSSPLFLIVSLFIVLDSRGGIIFRQQRAGIDGKPFVIYKFRSLIADAEKKGAGHYFSGNDDPRITRVGRVLRRTSIDELPQLFNVLKGDMSIVGPRPALLSQVDNYTKFQRKRLLVKPGITGWAQINGRNILSWSQKIILDIWYIDNYCLTLDLRIMFKTIAVIFKGTGIRYDLTKEQIEDFDKGGDHKSENTTLGSGHNRSGKTNGNGSSFR